jgi:hypothetical protein
MTIHENDDKKLYQAAAVFHIKGVIPKLAIRKIKCSRPAAGISYCLCTRYLIALAAPIAEAPATANVNMTVLNGSNTSSETTVIARITAATQTIIADSLVTILLLYLLAT